jgi:hypothetical protein
MKYLKEYNSFSVDQIEKGIKKSVSKGDIDLKTDVNNIIDNIMSYNFEVGSVESFLNNDNNFIAESIPDKLIKYIKDNNLDIDTSKLEEYNIKKKELDKISDSISILNYSYSDDEEESELTELYLKEEELEEYIDLLKKEVLKIKTEIKNKIS